MRPASADIRVIAVLKPCDEALAPGLARRRLNLGVCRALTTHADVLAHRVVKEIVILRHERDLIVKLGEGNVL